MTVQRSRGTAVAGLATIGLFLTSQIALAQDLAAPAAAPVVPVAQAPQPVVVELFTAQGCAACPPADAAFAAYAARSDVIALALHVDYWDYLGWEDHFALPELTQRQKDYARAVGDRMVYTPQVVINGLDRLQGTRSADIESLIAARLAEPSQVALKVSRGALGQVVIEATAVPPLAEAPMVQLVRYTPEETVDIERGENAGRSVVYHNIVSDWSLLGHWDSRIPLALEAMIEGEAETVVILQEAGPGRILAAASLE